MPDDQLNKTANPNDPNKDTEAQIHEPIVEETGEECVFCQIASGEIPSETVFHDQDLIAFYDIEPKAPVHILVIPRQHIRSVAEIEKGDQVLVGNMIWVAKYLAESHRISDGYKIVFNTGISAGQTVPHMHLHLLGGQRFGEEVPV